MNTETNFKSKFPRHLLNEIKWKGYDILKCTIYYTSRGSPGNTAITEGSQIKEIGKGFLILYGVPYEKYIPYHRITRIDYENKVVFDRCTINTTLKTLTASPRTP